MSKYEEKKEALQEALSQFEMLLINEPQEVPNSCINNEAFSETKEEWIEEMQEAMAPVIMLL